MKPALPPRLFFVIVLVIALLPAAAVYGGLPGPAPPAPPPIPTPPPDSGFDYVKVDDARGQSGVATQIEIGTSGKDKIVLYGGKDSVTQYTGGSYGNDWLLQVGGEKTSTQTIAGGSGDDTIYQYGSQGSSKLVIDGASGNDTMVQVGGQGDNEMIISGSRGNDHIEQYGGSGNNVMNVSGMDGDNIIAVYGGPRNNSMYFDMWPGNDVVTILGGKGGGQNTLKINMDYNAGNLANLALKDYQGRVLFQSGTGGDRPSTAPVAVLSATGGIVTAGEHSLRITFVTPQGETGTSPASAAVLADGAHAIDVSQIPLGPAGTTARKIYMSRIVDKTADPCFLAGTLSNNTATTYTINVPDVDLGPYAPGSASVTVANMNRITVYNSDLQPIWQYSGGATSAALPLLLLGD